MNACSQQKYSSKKDSPEKVKIYLDNVRGYNLEFWKYCIELLEFVTRKTSIEY